MFNLKEFLSEARMNASEEALFLRLYRSVARRKGPNNATKLWRALLHMTPEHCQTVLFTIENELGCRISWAHLDRFIRVIDLESDQIVDEYFGGNVLFTTNRNRIKEAVADYRKSKFDLHADWSRIGFVTYELKFALTHARGSAWRSRPKGHQGKRLVNCRLCWRFTVLTERRRAYCKQHRPGTTEYLRARKLSLWAPFASGKETYVERYRRGIYDYFPSKFRIGFSINSSFQEIIKGNMDAITEIQPFKVALPSVFRKLPRIAAYLKKSQNHIPHKPTEILSVLDPLCSKERALHERVHEAMIKDQRLLLEMLILAECWMHTAQVRSRYKGGSSNRYKDIELTLPSTRIQMTRGLVGM